MFNVRGFKKEKCMELTVFAQDFELSKKPAIPFKKCRYHLKICSCPEFNSVPRREAVM
jgi:hypothetical protein